MHLKNFSLYSPKGGKYILTPTYDQVSTKVVMPEDREEMALTLNGFQKKLLVYDFREAMLQTGIDEVVANRILSNFANSKTSGWNVLRHRLSVTIKKSNSKR